MFKMPGPGKSFYFRTNYGSEALYDARKEVETLYPNRPIETEVHGDYRAKDSFSLRCLDIESELKKGTPAKDVLSIVKQWAPLKRTDLMPDDIASGTIEYNQKDPYFFNVLIEGDKQQSLTSKGAKRALHQLTKNGPPQADRVLISEAMKAALGPLEQVDIFKPLPTNQKVKTPHVVCASNILHYGDPQKQNQFAQNLQDTCAEGSRLVVGVNESRRKENLERMPFSLGLADYLPDMLFRHGFSVDQDANQKLKAQRVENATLCSVASYHTTPTEQVVYMKTAQ